ncbi:VTC domain-containing protein [Amedibacillus sp. YH-ame10]
MQNTFERTEKKYVLTQAQCKAFYKAILPYIEPDEYAQYSIYNIYFDTEHFDLIRNSLDKPPYKEKLRMRCYEMANEETKIFVELKKKYDHTVFKRRVICSLEEANNLIYKHKPLHNQTQIVQEILYFLDFYQPTPKLFLSYDRLAYHGTQDSSLRITFDQNIQYRTHDLTLTTNVQNHSYFQQEEVLMEIKVATAFPLWLTNILSSMEIYPASFSKYGKIYSQKLFPEHRKEFTHVS